MSAANMEFEEDNAIVGITFRRGRQPGALGVEMRSHIHNYLRFTSVLQQIVFAMTFDSRGGGTLFPPDELLYS